MSDKPEKKPNFHKTLFILILVFIPPYFLMFTEEGTRMSDSVMLWLLGEDEIKLNVKELNSGFSVDDIKKVFADNEWQCAKQESPFGDSLCITKIGTFNGYPSRALTFFFRDNHVSAFKLVYRKVYHEQIIGYFIELLGQPDNVAAALADGPDAAPVLQWKLNQATLLIKKKLDDSDEPSVIWIAAKPAAAE